MFSFNVPFLCFHICVLQSPHHMNGPTGSQPEHNSSAPALGVLVILAGAAAILGFLYMRHHRKPF